MLVEYCHFLMQRGGFMEQATAGAPHRAGFPVIIGTAVLQGWALYGLHRAILDHAWPATDNGWLYALYAVAVLIPVTIELLADRVRDTAAWLLVAVLALLLLSFGWHHGRAVHDTPIRNVDSPGDDFSLALVLGIFWLHAMPFIQARLAAGKWTLEYRYLFAYAWRNAVSLAEALLFTGCFWLLLALWQLLFHMLGIEFFRELFEKPIFIYPVTSIVFGSALHLIGSIDRLVSAVLEQILSVFKWLGTVTGALLALFSLALVVKLPDLVFTGQKAIGAAWLLWLVAVVVLFLNAAYRDGSTAQPYPRWIGAALRIVVPLTTVIALTATYALYVRTQHYGLTVPRVWAFIVAGAALIYAVGYSIAAFDAGIWFGGIARVNVLVAACLVLVLGLAMTPLLSPYRLAADSQYRLALAGGRTAVDGSGGRDSPYQYLRFASGAYGRRRLELLAQLRDHPQAPRIRELAHAALGASLPWQTVPTRTDEEILSGLKVFPPGRAIDADLGRAVRADLHGSPNPANYCIPQPGRELTGLFADLDADGTDEFILWNACTGTVYQQSNGHWRQVATLSGRDNGALGDMAAALSREPVSTTRRPWQDLWIGKRQFQVNPNP
jgi:Domain of unknown function (DUF4153)